jgi:hypothetical protein
MGLFNRILTLLPFLHIGFYTAGSADHDTNHAPTGYADAGANPHQLNRAVNCGTGIWR